MTVKNNGLYYFLNKLIYTVIFQNELFEMLFRTKWQTLLCLFLMGKYFLFYTIFHIHHSHY